MKQAVILAAGLGSRLGNIQGSKPKSLLEVSNIILLDRTLKALQKAEFQEIYIVVGYQKELIIQFVNTIENDNVFLIENPKFRDYGSMYSLSQASEYIRDGFYVFDGDLIWDEQILSVFVNQSIDSTILVEHSGSLDECLPYFEAGKFVGFRKNDPIKSFPEMIGITYIKKSTLSLMIEINAENNYGLPYENALSEAVKNFAIPFNFVYVPGLLWSDVDNLADLDRMKNVIKQLM
jgi:2-aminoethylphosphonate-pyruvate transaminase